jgi:hypothetical protein
MNRRTRLLLKTLLILATVAAAGLALHFAIRGLIDMHGG